MATTASDLMFSNDCIYYSRSTHSKKEAVASF
jgi:hypothetical protein